MIDYRIKKNDYEPFSDEQKKLMEKEVDRKHERGPAKVEYTQQGKQKKRQALWKRIEYFLMIFVNGSKLEFD